ncbi:MAG: hypothetical protein ABGX83_05295 [Nitrospira sp.]
MLKGKKTYIIAIAAGLVVAAEAMGYINGEFAAQILTFLGIGGAVAMRAGIEKSGPDA